MTVALAALGWVVAAGALAVALATRRELEGRMERLARATHELRRPLTAARLAAHGLAGATGDRAARAAAIERELARAGRLLGDLDGVRGAVAPPWLGETRLVVVPELLADVAETWAPSAAAQGRRVVLEPWDEVPVVRGDADRLAQALGNVVANALEHGLGTVRLGVRARGARVVLTVADAGPGPQKPLDVLGRAASAGRGARGRGLAIVADIARAHGGAVRVEQGDVGARLVIDLPRAAGTASVSRPEQAVS
jgi:signal transduction histidine kinase